MKLLFTIVLGLLSFSVSAQIDLVEVERILAQTESGKYYKFLEEEGFKLIESKKEGRVSFFEKWESDGDKVYLSIQHNDNFGFTKVIFSSTDQLEKKSVTALVKELNKKYSLQSANNKDFFMKESDPGTTVHLLTLEDNSKVEGVLFFRKF